MSIQNNFPALKPTLLLDFANTKELDPRITFTRASTATYYGTQTAVAEQNGLLQSQDFATTWTTNNTVVASNTTIALDGTVTADTITENTVSSFHIVSQGGLALLSNTVGTMTLSVFAKLGTGTRYLTIGLSTDITTNNGSATFDLSTGTNTQTQNNGTWTSASATITAVAQGFYRCTLTVTTDSAGTGLIRIGLNNTSTPTTANRGFGADYVGDGTSSIIVWGAQIEKRSVATAYIPTTTQPIANYIPVLETAASGVARFDHNPVTDESLGLLIEESRTNLLTYSEQFDNAAWTKTQSSIVPNTVVAPTGLLTGDLHLPNTTAAEHSLSQNFSFVSGTTYTFSVYLKAAGYTQCRIRFQSSAFSGTAQSIDVDLVAGTAVSTSGSPISTINNVGNGWYRVTSTATATTTISAAISVFPIIGGSTTGAGNGYSGVYIWGAQLEAGAATTSYIPTVASQVTRAADAASMTGTNFSSWYNQAEGAFFSSVVLSQTPAVLSGVGIYAASDGTTSNRVFVTLGSGLNGNINTVVSIGGALQAQTINAGLSTAGAYSHANSYKVNDFASVVNNGVAVTDTSGIVPVVNRLYLGAGASGTGYLNSTIKKIAYYPIRVTNAQLQALTS